MLPSPSSVSSLRFIFQTLRLLSLAGLIVVLTVFSVRMSGESLEFDVVSIKRNATSEPGARIQSLPDGTAIITNAPITFALSRIVPVPLRDVVGLPEWANTERYDIAAKPPIGSTSLQRRDMWRAMFEDRLKLAMHVEERKRDIFTLRLADRDSRLGPQLKRSTIDCKQLPTPSPSKQQGMPTVEDWQTCCGIGIVGATMVSGGTSIDSLALVLASRAGRAIDNVTGLEGLYAFTLTFSRRTGPAIEPTTDNLPDLFTAVQEQLGLRLQPGTKLMPVYVVDHIERPSEH